MATHVESEENKPTIIERIPWKKYIPKIFGKIVLGLIILVIFILIAYFSSKITLDRNEYNPPYIIGIFTQTYLILIILSSTLFILVLAAFVKTLFFDHREEFGLTNLRTKRVFFVFLLVVSFISAVYTLLDIALQNVYMTLGPVDVIWAIDNILNISLPTITANTDRLAYSQIRGYYFIAFYLFMLIFPIFMFLALLTRYGRNKVFKKPEQLAQRNKETPFLKIFGVLFGPILIVFFLYLALGTGMTTVPRFILLISLVIFAIWWVYQLIKLLLKGLKLSAYVSYSNVIIFFPLLFLFYLFPVILWTGWDLFEIYSMGGSTAHTSLTELGTPLANTVINFHTLSLQGYWGLVVQIFLVNAVYIVRILQLDFVFVVGLSAIAIGFSEGYSIIAIFTSLFKGVNVARTGRVATQSSPKLVVMATRIIMLGAWISFFWDRIVIIIELLKEYALMYFPYLKNIQLPRIFEIFSNLNLNLHLNFLGYVLPLTILIIPLYYILMSSFKFLGVSLIVDKTKGDQQIFFLLISAAFVLITTNILTDISAYIAAMASTLPPGTPSFTVFLPTTGFWNKYLFWSDKIFEFLESTAFFGGLLVAVVVTLRNLKKKLQKREVEQEIEKRDRHYSFGVEN